MAWRIVRADQVRSGDLVHCGSGEFWRVTTVMEPNDEWPRGFELTRWRDVSEDELFEIDRSTEPFSGSPAPALDTEVEY